ncbi:MAG: TonB-dependent receptor [Salinivirgaceae bacterium]
MKYLKPSILKYFLLAIILFNVLLTKSQENALNNKLISGLVTTGDNELLPGVNISVEGTSIGTVSSTDGTYTIKIPESAKTLVFSMIGFENKTVSISGQSLINVVLIPDLISISEVVIVGYGKQKKQDITGSVSSVSTKDFDLQPVTGVNQVLQGRSAGVEVVSNSGAPGGDVKIRIRGANSIIGNNNPLIVVDGVIDIDLNSISPNDIQSIEILKDASSTAIFGSRGANGVVIVTTKSGSDGKAKVSFNTFFSMSELPKKIDYLNAGEFANLYNIYDSTIRYVPGFVFYPAFTDEEVAFYEDNGGTDWQNELFRQGSTESYELAIQGGNKDTKYYISGEYLNQNGIVVNSGYKRFSVRSKLASDITEKLNINLNISGNHQKGRNNNDVGSQFSPIGRMPQWVATESVWDETGAYYNYSPEHGAVAGNPIGLQMTQNTDIITNSFLPSAGVNYTILPGFDVKASVAVEVKQVTNNTFNNNELLLGPNGQSTAGVSNHQSYRNQYSIIANYEKEIDNHSFGITGIYEESGFKQEGCYANANDLNSSLYGYHNLALSASQQASSYYYDEYLRSFAARINYSFLKKYLFTATVRSDGSSKFKDENKYGFFPSAALGWRMSEEEFIKNLNVFSNLKFRLSYGITGSQAVGSYSTLPYFVQNSSTDYGVNGPTGMNSTGLGIGSPGNPDLKWESTAQSNIGLEMGFFKGRLDLEADFYNKITSDLLLNYQLPYYAGNAPIIRNIGEVSNKGFELMANATAFNSGNINWKIGFNFSLNRNEVLDLGDEDQIFPGSKYGDESSSLTIIKVGEELGTFYGYKYLGVWKSYEADEAAIYGNKPGDAKYNDLNNDGLINTLDLQIIGQAQPDFSYGINNTFSYKNFEVNIFIQGVKGGQIFNGIDQKSFGLFGQSKAFTSPELFNRWTPENEDTEIPAFSGSSILYPGSSRWLEDRSFVRLKNLTVAYNIPEQILTKANITQFQLYISGTNLLTFTKYKGYDPEGSTAGNTVGGGSNTDVDQNIDTGAYPNSRTYTIGLKVSF